MIASFNFLKSQNSNLKNIFIGTNNLAGGNPIPHSWNSIYILNGDQIILTHIDPTFADNNSELEAEKGYHFPKNDIIFKARIANGLWLHEESYDLFNKLIKKIIPIYLKKKFSRRWPFYLDD